MPFRGERFPKLLWFNEFGKGTPIAPSDPFRENIRLLLEGVGKLEDYQVLGNPLWCILLYHHKMQVIAPLYIIQEDHYHCRCLGKSGNYASERSYHFIIPVNGWDEDKPLDEGVLDNQNHLLHGVIHCNGHGHLLCVNGIKGGSKAITGREIMDLWDRICTSLLVRKIDVEDVSRKRSMDLRLLHGVAYGHSWFGRWGYRFCHGSFASSTEHEQHYNGAMETLGSLELDVVATDLSKTKHHGKITRMIRCYRDLSETDVTTMRDLLRLMLTIKTSHALVSKMKDTSGGGGGGGGGGGDSSKGFISRNSTKCKTPLDRSIHQLCKGLKAPKLEPEAMANADQRAEFYWVPGKDVYCDVLFLYKNLLLGYPDSAVNSAVQTILDSKHFAKEWPAN